MENHTPACRARKLPRRDENEVRTQLSKKTPLVKKLVNNSYYFGTVVLAGLEKMGGPFFRVGCAIKWRRWGVLWARARTTVSSHFAVCVVRR